jgi:hypothetical protein
MANTIEYKWLGPGEALDRCLVLEVVPIGRRFWRGAVGRTTSKKAGRGSDQRNPLPKGGPAALPKGDPADVTVQVGRRQAAAATVREPGRRNDRRLKPPLIFHW